MYPKIIQSLVYAGLISNSLAIIVCIFFKEYDIVVGKSFVLAIWIFNYMIHKKAGTF